MSRANVEKFFKKAGQSPELKKKLKAVTYSGKSPQSIPSKIAELAKESGFVCSAQDIEDLFAETAENIPPGSKLADKDLQMAVGGSNFFTATWDFIMYVIAETLKARGAHR